MNDILIRPNAGSAKDHWNNVIQLATVRGPGNFSAIVYKCLLNEDIDGAPNCYGPLDREAETLDKLKHATSNENHVFSKDNHNFEWHGLYSLRKADAPKGVDLDTDPMLEDRLHRFPVKQKSGFYVSMTPWHAKPGQLWDQATYLDATRVPYGAITPPLEKLQVSLGDLGFAVRGDKRIGKGFVFGDAGAQNKVGEVSRNLFRTFFPRADQEGHPVVFIVFPGVAAGATTGKALDDAVKAQFRKLTQASSTDRLARHLTLPPHLNVAGPRDPEPIVEPPAENGSGSEMDNLRSAIRNAKRPLQTVYERDYLDLVQVLRQFGMR